MNLTYQQAIEKAAILKELGETDIYLSGADDAPWAEAESCEQGGTHRHDMATSVWFRASINGLNFRWLLDIESRDANGKGYYKIDIDLVKSVIGKLQGNARIQFREYLINAAQKVRDKGDEYQKHANKQLVDSAILRDLACL